jgi:hypothetical protein
VAWENIDFAPTQGQTYLRPTVLPSDTVQAELGDQGRDYHTGIYQVDVMAEAGEGKNAAYVLADSIADHFARGTDLTYNGVVVTIQQTKRLTGRTDSGWFMVPVEINFFSYTAAR